MGTLKAFNKILFGRKTVATAGVAIILLDGTTITQTLTIKALKNNTGDIFVGNSTVDSANGFPVSPGETVSLDIDHNGDNVYIDAATSGDGVAFIGGELE